MSAETNRQVDYLDGWRIAVSSSSTTGFAVSNVLTALGASVTVSPAEAGLADLASSSAYDAVICDRIALGADAAYLEQVSRWLEQATGSPRAWVTVSAFGLDGPAAGYRGSNFVCSAAGGLLAAVADPSGTLFELPGSQALHVVGQLAALAALHGVSLSRETGAPVHQELSAQEGITFSTIQQELAHLIGRCGGGTGALPRYGAPSGDFACKDGLIKVSVLNSHQFARFTEVVDQPDWMAKYPTNPDRSDNAEIIDAVMQEWAAERSADEAERILQAGGVPATAVRAMDRLGESPQFQARGWPATFTSSSPAVLPALVDHRDNAVPAAHPDRRLGDLHVLEVTNVLAGPLSGAILGAMGADVVRLEDVSRMDIYRTNGPFVDFIEGIDRAAYFLGANHSKRSVVEGVGQQPEVPQGALAWSNVMIENVGPGWVRRLGIESQSPGAGTGGIAISISGFGRTGPCAEYRGYGPNVHGFAGLDDALTRFAGPGVTVRTPFADYCVAIWTATFASAWWLGGSGRDDRVDLSMAEVIAEKLVSLLIADAPAEAGDNLVVRFSDTGQLAVSLASAGDRQRSVDALEAAGLLADQSGSPDDLLIALTHAGGVDPDATVAALQAAGVAAYVVKTTAMTPSSILDDAQLRARNFFLAVDHPVVGDFEIIPLPWKVHGSSRSGYRPAPLFGQDNAWSRGAFGLE